MRAAASLGWGMVIDAAKNQVPGGKGLPSAGLALCRAGDRERAHVANCHTRDFADTHMKTRRFARPGSFGHHIAASHRLVASVQYADSTPIPGFRFRYSCIRNWVDTIYTMFTLSIQET